MFLHVTLFPSIRNMGYTIREDPHINFVRVRVNKNVWLVDSLGSVADRLALVQDILNRTCLRLIPVTREFGGNNHYCNKTPEYYHESERMQ